MFYNFKRYSQETPLHGFNIACHAYNKWDLACWFTMIFACFGMFIQQTVQLAKVYQGEPTSTYVTLRSREPIVLPDLVLCIMFGDFITKYNRTLSYDTLLNLLQDVNVSDLIRTQTEPEYLPSMDVNLISYLLEMLGRISAAEWAIAYDEPAKKELWDTGRSNMDLSLAMSHLHSFIINNKIPLIQLLKVTVSSICMRMKLSVTNQKSSSFNVCSPNNVVYLDYHQFSIRLSDNMKPVRFATLKDVMILQFNASAVYNRPSDFPLQSALKFYLLFDGSPFQDLSTGSGGTMLVGQMESKSCVSLRLRSSFKAKNLKRKPCSVVNSNFVCENICWAQLLLRNCSCWPISLFPYKPQLQTFCSEVPFNNSANINEIPQLAQCRWGNSPFYPKVPLCQQNCPNDCQSKEYEFTQETNASSPNCAESEIFNFSSDSSTSLMLMANGFTYTLIEESVVKDWQTFLSEFGGLLGVWLGGSIMAFFHIPMFLIKTVYFWKNDKKRRPTQTRTAIRENNQKLKSISIY